MNVFNLIATATVLSLTAAVKIEQFDHSLLGGASSSTYGGAMNPTFSNGICGAWCWRQFGPWRFWQWASASSCFEPTLWIDQIRKVVYAGEMTEGHNSRIRTKTIVNSSVSDWRDILQPTEKRIHLTGIQLQSQVDRVNKEERHYWIIIKILINWFINH